MTLPQNILPALRQAAFDYNVDTNNTVNRTILIAVLKALDDQFEWDASDVTIRCAVAEAQAIMGHQSRRYPMLIETTYTIDTDNVGPTTHTHRATFARFPEWMARMYADFGVYMTVDAIRVVEYGQP